MHLFCSHVIFTLLRTKTIQNITWIFSHAAQNGPLFRTIFLFFWNINQKFFKALILLNFSSDLGSTGSYRWGRVLISIEFVLSLWYWHSCCPCAEKSPTAFEPLVIFSSGPWRNSPLLLLPLLPYFKLKISRASFLKTQNFGRLRRPKKFFVWENFDPSDFESDFREEGYIFVRFKCAHCVSDQNLPLKIYCLNFLADFQKIIILRF